MSTETAHAATGRTDLDAITKVVATVERTQRAKDAEGFLALFHPDALWTTGHGKVLIGFDAIAEFTRAVLPAASWDGEVTYEVAHTRFLRPDVAAVNQAVEALRKAMVDADKASLEGLVADQLSYGHSGGRMCEWMSIFNIPQV